MIKVITGNEAAAYGVLVSRVQLACAYPITPQSQMIETIARFKAEGLFKGDFINAESEMGAISIVIGANAGGIRVFTASASQGLMWMHEGLHWAAGGRMPIVMAVVNRPLAPPGNLTCNQTDSLSQRDTGWMQFYCESNQEVLDTVIQAYKIAETVHLPAMVCLDGVYLSYISESVDIPDQEKVDQYLPPYNPTFKGPKRLGSLVTNLPPDPCSYNLQDHFMSRYEQHKLESKCVDTALKANEEFMTLFGRSYPIVEEYKCDDADTVLVVSGSAAGTARLVINHLREEGHKVGMIKHKMFRPFPRDLVRRALLGKKKVAVIDRNLSPGQGGIFCQEIKWALKMNVESEVLPVYGFVSGLGGEDISAQLIERAVLYTLKEEPPEQDVIWLGLPQKKNGDEYDMASITIAPVGVTGRAPGQEGRG